MAVSGPTREMSVDIVAWRTNPGGRTRAEEAGQRWQGVLLVDLRTRDGTINP